VEWAVSPVSCATLAYGYAHLAPAGFSLDPSASPLPPFRGGLGRGCQRQFGGGASPAGTTSCLTAGGAQRNPWNNAADLTTTPFSIVNYPLSIEKSPTYRRTTPFSIFNFQFSIVSTCQRRFQFSIFNGSLTSPLFPESPLSSSPRHPLPILPYFIIQGKIRGKRKSIDVPTHVNDIPAHVNDIPAHVNDVPARVNDVPARVNEINVFVNETKVFVNEINVFVNNNYTSLKLNHHE
jgi:hypothetical protein